MRRSFRLVFLRILALVAARFVRRASGPVRQILFVKPDHLGDLLLSTPVLAALRQRFPETRITALVGPWGRLAIERNPHVDQVHVCPFPGFERSTTHGQRQVLARLGRVVAHYTTLLRFGVLLRAARYDAAIIGRDDHWWGAALALVAGIPVRVGFAVPECRPFITTALPWNPRDHVTGQGLTLVEALGQRSRVVDHREGTHTRRRTSTSGIRPHPPSPAPPRKGDGPAVPGVRSVANTLDTFPPGWTRDVQEAVPARSAAYHADGGSLPMRFIPADSDQEWAIAWLAEHGLAAQARFVVVHPGTGGPDKHWLPDRWSNVADALLGQTTGLSVVLTGGPGEEALVAEVAARMHARPFTLAGQTSLGQLAALLERATLVLGVDSGPLHLAVAVGTPTIHLFGPSDAARFGPWGDPQRHVIVRAGLWCSPCGVFAACPRGLAIAECMEQISVAHVVAEALRLVEEETRSQEAR
jgi:heptosyltransferase-2/heptosyltransferase-3